MANEQNVPVFGVYVDGAEANSTLPAGLSLNAASGILSGTATSIGSSTVTITVTDALARTSSKSVTFTIR